jgi:hypothetical protein
VCARSTADRSFELNGAIGSEDAAMTQKIPQTPPEYDRTRIIERPDGFYWQAKDTGREYGPFPNLLEAVADMQAAGETGYEPGETLEEAESEIGIADWIDAETGAPAEESVPRIEDH